MKLTCDLCGAVYTIADEKVRGKTLTLRCKTCGNTIRARGPEDVRGSGAEAGSGKGTGSAKTGRYSVLDRPLKAAASLRPTKEVGISRPAEPETEKKSAPPPGAPAVKRFSSDEGGRLVRASREAPKDSSKEGSVGGSKGRMPFGSTKTSGGDFTTLDDGGKTTVASFDSIAAALHATADGSDEEWYLSVDGEQHGPFSKEVLEEEIPKYPDAELYVWKEGFEDWKPIEDVPELDPELRLAPPPPAGVVKGPKPKAAEQREALRRSPWASVSSPAAKEGPRAERASRAAEGEQKGLEERQPLAVSESTASSRTVPEERELSPTAPQKLSPGEGKETTAAVAQEVSRESSGAEVVSIEKARGRAASRQRGASARSAGATEQTRAEEKRTEAPCQVPKAPAEQGVGDQEHAGLAPAVAPEPIPESEERDDLFVVSEPSQVVRLKGRQIISEIPAATGEETAETTPLIGGAGAKAEASVIRGHVDENEVATGVMVPHPHRVSRALLAAAIGGAVATLTLASVVVYLVARGPQVQVREIVRLKSPEELGADTDVAVARLLAEKQFGTTARSGQPNQAGIAGRENASKRPGGPGSARPTPAGGPAKTKPTDAKAPNGSGMADFFKGSGGTSPGLAAPNLEGPRGFEKSSGRKVSDEEIVRAVNRQRGTLTGCYNRALKYDNSLKSVRLDVTVKVGISGRAVEVLINQKEHRSSFLGTCLSDAIRRWTFPSGGEEYTTVIPLVLQGD